jgi:hypothetical protein|tara:strand:- start:838 stop:1191 length:354 start_codon:yes stop_codon:yes gene_type:complete
MDKSYFISDLIEKKLIRHSDFENKARSLYDGFDLLYKGCQGHTSPEVFNQAFKAASPHKTTQQALVGSVFALLHSIAEMEGNEVDGRNEYAIELAQNLLGAYKEKYGLELPKQLPCI